jgi:uncharacterized protein (TIGR02598 family)
MSPSPVRFTRGFSLVEVVLAVGVVAFAFVAILGLIPAGMTQFRQAIDTTVCAQIAQRVIGDAQQTNYDELIDREGMEARFQTTQAWTNFTFRAPTIAQPEYRYFDERGAEVVPSTEAARRRPTALSPAEKTAIVYHVLVRVMPQTRIPRTGTGGTAGGDEVATITIQVAHNPSNRELEIDSSAPDAEDSINRNLYKKTPGVNVITYAAQVARN